MISAGRSSRESECVVSVGFLSFFGLVSDGCDCDVDKSSIPTGGLRILSCMISERTSNGVEEC
jgi:hypothetical protein